MLSAQAAVMRTTGLLILFILVFAASTQCKDKKNKNNKNNEEGRANMQVKKIDLSQKTKWSKAVFAGGCFWCMEPPFDKRSGVKATISGYAGGKEQNPSYKEVSSGLTSHIESVLVLYDPAQVSFSELVDIFWKNIDPTQTNGQFYDIGEHYKTRIFYLNEEQKKIAEGSKKKLAASGKFSAPIATTIAPVQEFWSAEEYHQNYYQKNPAHYYQYRKGSGRDAFIKKHWGEE